MGEVSPAGVGADGYRVHTPVAPVAFLSLCWLVTGVVSIVARRYFGRKAYLMYKVVWEWDALARTPGFWEKWSVVVGVLAIAGAVVIWFAL